MLFYTNYGAGQIMSVNLAPGGNPTPTLVTTIQGALDGLVLDACGNLYAVDNGDAELYRVRLDAAGVAQGPAELLASFPTSVANAQFGSGQGFDPMTLYVTGNPGTIYAVAAGVAGALVPTPP
jgi:sugar lactone lactonase YvrE